MIDDVMVHLMIYSLRGWIAFVAFINMATAFRCYLDTDTYLNRDLIAAGDSSVSAMIGRIFGAFHVLVTIVLIHSAFRIEYYPLISCSLCTLLFVIVYFALETFRYTTFRVNFYSLSPILVSVFTMIGIISAPKYLSRGSAEDEKAEQELQLIMSTRKKRWNRRRI